MKVHECPLLKELWASLFQMKGEGGDGTKYDNYVPKSLEIFSIQCQKWIYYRTVNYRKYFSWLKILKDSLITDE